MSPKSLIMCCALVAFFALNQQTARADEILISGTTTGAFNGESSTLLGLTYNSGSFSGMTSGGILELNANPTLPTNVNNLGSFTLSVPPNGVYDNNFFTLQVLFNSPGGISGSNPRGITGTLVGSVVSDTNGLVGIDFGNVPTVFSFDSGSGPQTFSLLIDPVRFNLAQPVASFSAYTPADRQITVALTGTVQVTTPTPEPTTLLLLGTGLAGVVAKVRRRRQTKQIGNE